MPSLLGLHDWSKSKSSEKKKSRASENKKSSISQRHCWAFGNWTGNRRVFEWEISKSFINIRNKIPICRYTMANFSLLLAHRSISTTSLLWWYALIQLKMKTWRQHPVQINTAKRKCTLSKSIHKNTLRITRIMAYTVYTWIGIRHFQRSVFQFKQLHIWIRRFSTP